MARRVIFIGSLYNFSTLLCVYSLDYHAQPRKMKIHNLLQGAFMKTLRRVVTITCIAAMALLSSGARGQVVKQIPSDALIVR